MNQPIENKEPCCSGKENESKCCCNLDYTAAFLLLRGWLAMRAIVTGIEKFGYYNIVQKPVIDPTTGMEDPSGAMVEVKMKAYSLTHYAAIPDSLKDKFALEPFLPKVLTTPFYAALGPVLIGLGLMLLVGAGTRISLFLQGLLYIGLTFGLILIKQDDGVAWLGIHLALIALALMLVKHNRFAICKKC